ncbi:MAG: oxygenase MpaB family protein [Actinomycetota bacterium]|nr:oxygenase MpaB family protein [Actinomycetota bacterium]
MTLTRTCPSPVAPLRRVVLSPVRSAFGADRFPEEQYTDPPGDPGLFGPDSVTWRIHADASMLIGGVGAIILQTLHPLAMAGVAEHSDYRHRPFERLSRTSSFVTATTYASTPAAEAIIARVRAIHRRVAGIAPDGRAYRADDPALLRWIHAAETSMFLAAHRRFHLLPVSPADQDRYCAEVTVVAERLGATDLPASRAELAAYFDAVRPELRAGEQARDALRYLRVPPFDRPALRGAYRLLLRAGIGLLPGWARDMLGLRPQPLLELSLVRPAAATLLGVMRVAGSPPVLLEQANARCAASVGAGPRRPHG